ncbi:MAG: alkaline phosphatase D family protein [Acidobacteriota bacterium]
MISRLSRTQTSRRHLLRTASLAALGSLVKPLRAVATPSKPRFYDYPFKLGVASGDPMANGFVLWTRLAPDPFDRHAQAMPAVEVRWEVASDEAMQSTVRSGTTLAHPERVHAVHVEVDGLEPDRQYFYRFISGDEVSAVGRARTSPLPTSDVDQVRLAVTSCHSITDAYFPALRDLAEQAPRMVVHVGDYFYESEWIGGIRRIPIPEAYSLADYRELHARYKLDPQLQAAHAACPWMFIWDDHEVVDNWGGAYNQQGLSPEQFAARKLAAFQAYYEHLPLRLSSRLRAEQMRIYQRAFVGTLMELNLLDCRQYRNDPPCLEQVEAGPRYLPQCEAARAPELSLLGEAQEIWLSRGLGRSGARWNVIVQNTQVAPFDYVSGEDVGYDLDDWNSFDASRKRLLELLTRHRPTNPIFLGGNIHAYYAGLVHTDPFDPTTEPLARELVATSLSAGGGGEDRYQHVNQQFEENPFARYFDNRHRGYLLCDVTPEEWVTQCRVVADVLDPDSPGSTLATLTMRSGETEIEVS